MKNKNLILIGAGGHTRVSTDIAILNNFKIKGIIDIFFKKKNKREYINSIPVIGGIDVIESKSQNHSFFISIGDNKLRKKYFNYLVKRNFNSVNLFHPNSIISKNVKFGKNIFIGPGAIVNSNTIIKNNVIINSNSIIEHEVTVSDHVNCSPGSIVCGRSTLNESVFIGAGSVVIENIEIGKNTFVASGSVVNKNFKKNLLIGGTPSKIIKKL